MVSRYSIIGWALRDMASRNSWRNTQHILNLTAWHVIRVNCNLSKSVHSEAGYENSVLTLRMDAPQWHPVSLQSIRPSVRYHQYLQPLRETRSERPSRSSCWSSHMQPIEPELTSLYKIIKILRRYSANGYPLTNHSHYVHCTKKSSTIAEERGSRLSVHVIVYCCTLWHL